MRIDRRLCLVLVLCAIFLSTAWGQAVEEDTSFGRPLRKTAPDSPLPVPCSPLPASCFPILTPDALEQQLTQHYIKQYTSPAGIAWLNAALKRGSIYIPFIQEEIQKRNMPPELLYLPIIESGFESGAKSKSGAMGLWQFMLNSIGPFDMKVNDMLDERRDFQKATRSALQKLEDNYRFLGNWPLALAAYNAGLGAVNRTVQKTGSRDYWLLCEKKELKNETIHYVPKLIAAAWVLSQPRRYGIDKWPEYIHWQTTPVGRQVSLELIAAEAGIDAELLRRGNMELLYGLTPSDNS